MAAESGLPDHAVALSSHSVIVTLRMEGQDAARHQGLSNSGCECGTGAGTRVAVSRLPISDLKDQDLAFRCRWLSGC
jgi:hypothetical protein